VVTTGSPVEILAHTDRSHTAQYLKAYLKGR